MWSTKLPINSSTISTSNDMVSDIGCLNDIDTRRLKVGVQPGIQFYLSSQAEGEEGLYIIRFSYSGDSLSEVKKENMSKKKRGGNGARAGVKIPLVQTDGSRTTLVLVFVIQTTLASSRPGRGRQPVRLDDWKHCLCLFPPSDIV